MYKVKMDGQTLYYPGDKEAVLTNPTLNLQTGYAGTFEFSVPPNNPLYDKTRTEQHGQCVPGYNRIVLWRGPETAESRPLQKQKCLLRRLQ